MKTRFLLIITMLVGGLLFQSCSKKDDSAGYPSGSRAIVGTITYTSDGTTTSPAPGAVVYLKIGSKNVTTAYDASTVADGNGKYKFSGLNKGDYFVRAEYTDPKGMKFTCTGSGVTLGASSGDCTADLNLQ